MVPAYIHTYIHTYIHDLFSAHPFLGYQSSVTVYFLATVSRTQIDGLYIRTVESSAENSAVLKVKERGNSCDSIDSGNRLHFLVS